MSKKTRSLSLVHHLFVLIALALSLPVTTSASATSSFAVPFVKYIVGEKSADLGYSPDKRRFFLSLDNKDILVPEDYVPQQFVPLRNERLLSFGRDLISGHLNIQILDMNKSTWTRVGLIYEERAHLFFHKAFKIDNDVFFLAYDVVRNTPSGRSATGLKTGLDWYTVAINQNSTQLKIRG